MNLIDESIPVYLAK